MIISPINNHANRTYSHRSAWGRMWGNCLGVPMGFNNDWSNEEIVYLEHGMEWKVGAKSINYFLASEKQLRELAYENKQRLAEGKLPKESSWEKLARKAKMFENFKGDWVHSYKTLPVVFGNPVTKFILSILILITCFLIYLLMGHNLGLIKYYFIFCVPYMFFILLLTWISSSKKMYLWIHNLLKLIIIIGVFGIYFMYK